MDPNLNEPQPPQASPSKTPGSSKPTSSGAFGSGGLRADSTSVPVQDLSDDTLLQSASKTSFNGAAVPSLGGIALLAKLGQGGMGAVYYGIHPRLNKQVAVKVLPSDMAERRPELIQRFYREAQLAARIESPHLVKVLDVNQEGAHFYLVMEFVDGVSAHAYLREAKKSGAAGLPEDRALDICLAACAGLAAAHAKGVIHRDLKPDNILIPRDTATNELNFKATKLADLGLARNDAIDSEMTVAGACLGTPGYMAPEQARNAKLCGKPSDIYGLGATLYALLAGNSPFHGNMLFQVMRATLEDPHVPINTHRPDVSQPTAVLLDRCLAKDPAQRYVDATALHAAMKSCRVALGEPSKTMSAIADVESMLRAMEVGDAVRPSNAPDLKPGSGTGPTPSGIKDAQAPASGSNPPKSRSALDAVAAVVAASTAKGIRAVDSKSGATPRKVRGDGSQPPAAMSALQSVASVVDASQKKGSKAPNVAPSGSDPKNRAQDIPDEGKGSAGKWILAAAAVVLLLCLGGAVVAGAYAGLYHIPGINAGGLTPQEEAVRKKEAAKAKVQEVLRNAISEAFAAKSKGDWQKVIDLLEAPLSLPENADYPSRETAEKLLDDAKKELQK